MAEYKDISTTKNNNNYLYDIDAINQSIDNILKTPKKTLLWDRDFGSRLNSLLFEPMTDNTVYRIKNYIQLAIGKYEKRISVYNVDVKQDLENHTYDVTMHYKILGNNLEETSTYKGELSSNENT